MSFFPMRSRAKSYTTIDGSVVGEPSKSTPWYWKLIALLASWMILGAYLIMPGLYDKKPELKFSQAGLSVFVVALMTAGYSFTVLLCFACRDPQFRSDSIFLPALTSSAVGLLTTAYNFLASHRYAWNTAAITSTVLSTTSTILYAFLLFYTHRRLVQLKDTSPSSRTKFWSEPSFYNNFIPNMYPTATRKPVSSPTEHLPLTEDDRITQQMALLLMKTDSGPSPDATSATFRIDLPEDREQAERVANSSELLGTPPPPPRHPDWNRGRTGSAGQTTLPVPDVGGRGRQASRPSSVGAVSSHSRAVSREERRREIELGS